MLAVRVAVLAVAVALATTRAQTPADSSGVVRVTVQMNPDGSRTTYEWDNANHKATATITDGGTMRERIRYVLDDAGHFVTGHVFGPDHKLRFTTRYKYDTAGRLAEETQLDKDGEMQHRIVHSYDSTGKESGYAVYDASGRLLSRSPPVAR